MPDSNASARVKVLRLIGRLNRGGPVRQLLPLCRDLSRERFDTVLAFGDVEEKEQEDVRPFFEAKVFLERIPHLSRSLHPFRDVAGLTKVAKLLRREKPQILHTHLAKAGVLGRIAARIAGVPIRVHTFHGTNFQGHLGSLASRGSVQLERVLAKSTQALVAVSQSVREELLTHKIAPPEKIALIPPGLDLDPFLAVSGRSGALREALRIGADEPLIGFSGRLVAVKNPMEFIEAAAAISIAMPQARFAVLGDGPLRETMRAQTEALDLRDRFLFAGWRDDMPACLADLDLLVCSSHSEGMPLGLIEAMAAGCFVVSRPVGGVPELLESGRFGALIGPLGEADLESSLLRWLPDRAGREGITRLARESVRERFAARGLVEDVARLYEILLAGGSASQFRSPRVPMR